MTRPRRRYDWQRPDNHLSCRPWATNVVYAIAYKCRVSNWRQIAVIGTGALASAGASSCVLVPLGRLTAPIQRAMLQRSGGTKMEPPERQTPRARRRFRGLEVRYRFGIAPIPTRAMTDGFCYPFYCGRDTNPHARDDRRTSNGTTEEPLLNPHARVAPRFSAVPKRDRRKYHELPLPLK